MSAGNDRPAREVWVFVEQEYGRIHPVAFELIGEGKRLADDLDGKLTAVLLGDDIDAAADQVFGHGADKVIAVDSPVLKDYRTFAYCRVLVKLIERFAPEIFLLGATTLGRDLAGAVATSIETGLTADCTELAIDPDSKLLTQTRPAFGGNVMATILCKTARPQMATVRPRVLKMPVWDGSHRGELIKVEVDLREEDVPTKVLDFIPHESHDNVEIEIADILVAGGRGLGNADNFALLHELAGLLGGEVAASRPPVEMGWLPYSRQIGQTGKTVRPRLYFAIGISGAVQHVVGMQDADVIVAINKDPDAPIFKIATFGLVGDLFDIVAALVDGLKQTESGARSAPEEAGADG